MFTGLIQTIGTVTALTRRGTGASIILKAPAIEVQGPLALGESIAVNGACLTLSQPYAHDQLIFDVLEETLRCTMLGTLRVGARVHLERALRVGDRLGGHFVTGHVDEVGEVLRRYPEGNDLRLRIGCSVALANRTIRKGSIAIAGVSLTVAAVGRDWLEVALIPTTCKETFLGQLVAGDNVNLEADILGAYAAKILGRQENSMERLISAGFADE